MVEIRRNSGVGTLAIAMAIRIVALAVFWFANIQGGSDLELSKKPIPIWNGLFGYLFYGLCC